MFEELRSAFREAVENFNKELRRDQLPETVDRLLVDMRKELVDETAAVRGLESELERATSSHKREREAAETCRRRERMARDIGDEETATLAARHAARHEGHQAVLERKVHAVHDELEFRRKSLREMDAQFHQAMQKRGSLDAASGRTGARQAFSEADELFGELDRMAEKMADERMSAEATEDLDSGPLGADFDRDLSGAGGPPPQELDVDAALQELKRRMGRP